MKNEIPLEQVISLSEACSLWGMNRNTIIWAYWNGDVELRKSGRTWLADVGSLNRYYGKPKYENVGDRA